MTSSKQPLRGQPVVKGFFEKRTFSIQYVVADPETKRAAIIDPVLDFDPKSGRPQRPLGRRDPRQCIEREGFTLEWILDTHPHADHFSAAGYLKDKTGVPTAIGEKVSRSRGSGRALYNYPTASATDGSQWDRLFADGERFTIGNMDVEVMFTPGHTLASIAYVSGDAAFIHDTIFMPDGGTARADFPGGSAKCCGTASSASWRCPTRHAPVHRARLHAGRARAALGEHGRRAAGEHAPHEGEDRGGVRGPARGARPRAGDAQAHPARSR